MQSFLLNTFDEGKKKILMPFMFNSFKTAPGYNNTRVISKGDIFLGHPVFMLVIWIESRYKGVKYVPQTIFFY